MSVSSHKSEKITTALLLAAGKGTRLYPLTSDSPKCLTEVNGSSILERLLHSLLENCFKRLVVVVGYMGDLICEYLEKHASNLKLEFIFNNDYAITNNIYSLWLAREAITEPFLLFESDIVFDSSLLSELLLPNRIAVSTFYNNMSGTCVKVDEIGHVTAFYVGNRPYPHAKFLKTVNIYSLSIWSWEKIIKHLDQQVKAHHLNDYYEIVFTEMVQKGELDLQAVFFDKGRWYEIDTLKDLWDAKRIFSKARIISSSQEIFSRFPLYGFDGSDSVFHNQIYHEEYK